MKILVLSDSHSTISFMRRCVESVQPNAIIHLGDYFEDGLAIKEVFPDTPMYQVPGNCDRYRCPPQQPEILVTQIMGVNFYLTHGHRHNVKMFLSSLLMDARKCHVDAVLYGHTHMAECYREADGLWVMNPGSCGYYGGSAGVIEVSDGKIVDCRIIRDQDLVRPW